MAGWLAEGGAGGSDERAAAVAFVIWEQCSPRPSVGGWILRIDQTSTLTHTQVRRQQSKEEWASLGCGVLRESVLTPALLSSPLACSSLLSVCALFVSDLASAAMSNWRSCGICCLGFSLFAIVFLVSTTLHRADAATHKRRRLRRAGRQAESLPLPHSCRCRISFARCVLFVVPCCYVRVPPLCLAVCRLQLVIGAVLDSKSETIYIEEDKRANAASNCKVGAGIYAGFVALSLACIFLPPIVCPPKKEEEESIDDYRQR